MIFSGLQKVPISSYYYYYYYRIAQNGGGGKLWRIGSFKNLVGKTLANCNESSLSCSIKTRHAKFKNHNR